MRPSEAFRQSVVRLRKRYGWRQVDLAERAGLERSALSKIERGVRGVSIDEMFAISAALGTSPTHLVAPGDGAELEVLAGDKPEVVPAHLVRAWQGGGGWVRPDGLPHVPAALHTDDWVRRLQTSYVHLFHLLQETLAFVDAAVDPTSEAAAAANDRLAALHDAIEATQNAIVKRSTPRPVRAQRVRKAA